MIKKLNIIFIFAFALVLSVPSTIFAQDIHWEHDGKKGPEQWGSLSPDFESCELGTEQSPIDIASTSHINPARLPFDYQASALNIVNNGHTVQANYDAGSSFVVDGKTYELLQIHFHNPSEHTIDGYATPLEMHLVHINRDGELAVVGVFLEEGMENAALASFFNNMPTEKGAPMTIEGASINAADLLPDDQSYWRINGSLTTPPCSEGVKWFVMTSPIEISADQIAAYTALYSGNARPTQPVHERDFIVDQHVYERGESTPSPVTEPTNDLDQIWLVLIAIFSALVGANL